MMEREQVMPVWNARPPLIAGFHRAKAVQYSGQDDQMAKPTMSKLSRSSRGSAAGNPGHWMLQDAKARFSELIRRVRSEGPQYVTVHGRDEVVVISGEEFRRLKGGRTGQSLIDALQASPHREHEIAPPRTTMPVRDVVL